MGIGMLAGDQTLPIDDLLDIIMNDPSPEVRRAATKQLPTFATTKGSNAPSPRP